MEGLVLLMKFFGKDRKSKVVGKVLGVGNCQIQGIVRCAAAALQTESAYLHPAKARNEPGVLMQALGDASVVFVPRGRAHRHMQDAAKAAGRPDLPVLAAPKFYFSGFHPDVVYPSPDGERPELPMGNASSAIVLAAWREGLEPSEAISLFRDEVYEALGYYEVFGLAKAALVKECAAAGFDVVPLLNSWLEQGAFVYLPLHPKIHVLRDIAMTQLRLAQLHDGTPSAEPVDDELSRNLMWPVYPEIGHKLGIAGDYIFRPKNMRGVPRAHLDPMDLKSFVERSYACFHQAPPNLSAFERLSDPRLDKLRRFAKAPALATGNPYRDRNDGHWWSKSVADVAPGEVDPVVRTKFMIGKNDKVATAGSCFAQHISRRLAQSGFNYLVTEQAPPECSEAAASDYGAFTARFGNIYTVRQLLQLADRAYGNLKPAIDAWAVPGGYLDPFRPRLAGGPFASLKKLNQSQQTHFAAVREMFETANIFVFTLGLTEAWSAAADEAIVPLHPGVVGADLPSNSYVPRNFTVAEVLEDLQSLVDLFRRLNPGVRILLTVSPVPLIATHGDDHVLAATTYSKSVLRVAAGETARSNAHVAYFPSYEIVTGSFNRGRYFADDLRNVTEAGVDHVMQVFLRHYAGIDAPPDVSASEAQRFEAEASAAMDIICDEEETASSVS